MPSTASVCLDIQVRPGIGFRHLCGTAELTVETQTIPFHKRQPSNLVQTPASIPRPKEYAPESLLPMRLTLSQLPGMS